MRVQDIVLALAIGFVIGLAYFIGYVSGYGAQPTLVAVETNVTNQILRGQ